MSLTKKLEDVECASLVMQTIEKEEVCSHTFFKKLNQAMSVGTLVVMFA